MQAPCSKHSHYNDLLSTSYRVMPSNFGEGDQHWVLSYLCLLGSFITAFSLSLLGTWVFFVSPACSARLLCCLPICLPKRSSMGLFVVSSACLAQAVCSHSFSSMQYLPWDGPSGMICEVRHSTHRVPAIVPHQPSRGKKDGQVGGVGWQWVEDGLADCVCMC